MTLQDALKRNRTVLIKQKAERTLDAQNAWGTVGGRRSKERVIANQYFKPSPSFWYRIIC
jgi:hypothetical protein